MQQLTMKYYQEMAVLTAICPSRFAVIYPAMGLANEAGEVVGKIKKVLRDNDGKLTPEHREKILDEMGDVLWYLVVLAKDLNASLDEIAQANLDKLWDRKERGVIGGSGDNR